MKHLQKRLGAAGLGLLALILATTARGQLGTPVSFPVRGQFGTVTGTLRIVAANSTWTDGTNIYGGTFLETNVTGLTNVIVTCQPNSYSVTLSTSRRGFNFTLPPGLGTNVVSVLGLSTNLVTYTNLYSLFSTNGATGNGQVPVTSSSAAAGYVWQAQSGGGGGTSGITNYSTGAILRSPLMITNQSGFADSLLFAQGNITNELYNSAGTFYFLSLPGATYCPVWTGNLNVEGVALIGGNLLEDGATALDTGAITTDGNGNLTVVSISGSGSGLTAVPAGQLTGTVPPASLTTGTNLLVQLVPTNATAISFSTNSTTGLVVEFWPTNQAAGYSGLTATNSFQPTNAALSALGIGNGGNLTNVPANYVLYAGGQPAFSALGTIYYAQGSGTYLADKFGNLYFFNGTQFANTTSLLATTLTGLAPTNTVAALLPASITGNAATASFASNLVANAAGGVTISNTALDTVTIAGNNGGYAGLNVQNFNPFGSSDISATADDGTSNSFNINLGYNGSKYGTTNYAPVGGHTAYLNIYGPTNNSSSPSNTANFVMVAWQTNAVWYVSVGNGLTRSNFALADHYWSLTPSNAPTLLYSNGVLSIGGNVVQTNINLANATGLIPTSSIPAVLSTSITGAASNLSGTVTVGQVTGGVVSNNNVSAVALLGGLNVTGTTTSTTVTAGTFTGSGSGLTNLTGAPAIPLWTTTAAYAYSGSTGQAAYGPDFSYYGAAPSTTYNYYSVSEPGGWQWLRVDITGLNNSTGTNVYLPVFTNGTLMTTLIMAPTNQNTLVVSNYGPFLFPTNATECIGFTNTGYNNAIHYVVHIKSFLATNTNTPPAP